MTNDTTKTTIITSPTSQLAKFGAALGRAQRTETFRTLTVRQETPRNGTTHTYEDSATFGQDRWPSDLFLSDVCDAAEFAYPMSRTQYLSGDGTAYAELVVSETGEATFRVLKTLGDATEGQEEALTEATVWETRKATSHATQSRC